MNRRNSQCAGRLDQKLRLLWSQHVYRTRFFIISTAADLADLSYVTNWLMQNPGDFAAVLEPFYGSARADEFKRLLTAHLAIGGELVDAAKAGDTAKADDARRRWYANADQIAEFLSDINPFWSRRMWTDMMYSHLKMTENEAGLRLAGRYPEDIAQFNDIEREAMEMADYMYMGMKRQFRLC